MKKNNKILQVESAKKIMMNSIQNDLQSEFVNINEAEGRILSKNIYSNIDLPRHNNSAVDGFGFLFNSFKKSEKFELVGESKPNKPFKKNIKKNQIVKFFTGAYVLSNTNIDTICFEENCKVDGNKVCILNKPKKGENIRLRGEDIKKNNLILKKGVKIRTVDLAQLSSVGLSKIKVFKKVKVGIFSTGDEIISGRQEKYKIYDSNKLPLVSLFKKIGCEAIDCGIIGDNLQESKNQIRKYCSKVDIIVTSGGISKSEVDKIGKLINKFGKIYFWQLAIKPGRPFAFGEINKTPIICLPGNPVAAIVTFFMLVSEYIKKFSGNRKKNIVERILPANFEMKKKKGRKEWLRGTIKYKNKAYYLENYKTTGSGIISSLTNSDGIIEVDENKSYVKKGMLLKFYKYEDILN